MTTREKNGQCFRPEQTNNQSPIKMMLRITKGNEALNIAISHGNWNGNGQTNGHTRRVRKVKIHHVYADREIFILIMATLPSTLILYL